MEQFTVLTPHLLSSWKTRVGGDHQAVVVGMGVWSHIIQQSGLSPFFDPADIAEVKRGMVGLILGIPFYLDGLGTRDDPSTRLKHNEAIVASVPFPPEAEKTTAEVLAVMWTQHRVTLVV